MRVVGIDLGTTNTVLAHVDEHGKVEVVPNAEADRLTPSVVLFEDAEVIVGKLALASAISEADRVVQFVKREMGRPGSTFEVGETTYTPEEVSAFILRKAKVDAEARLGGPIDAAVITVPAYFNDVQRKATEDAGRIAGLQVLGILNEPTAAALAHGVLSGASAERDSSVSVVFDLGGGTFDITVMRTGAGDVQMIATDGDDHLGGKDWDDRLITHAARRFEESHGANPLEDRRAYQDLAEKCEGAKIALSRKPKARIPVGHAGNFLSVEVGREEFEAMTEDLVARLEVKIRMVLDEAALGFGDVARFLLVGGSSRMPMIPALLARIAPGVPAIDAGHPDEVVAVGAAIHASVLAARAAGEAPAVSAAAGIELGYVNAHSLGVVARVKGEFTNCVLIPRNSPIPCTERGRFQTIEDGQTRIEVVVLEGEEKDPERCARIGTCVISDLPARPRGSPVTIEYSYDARGRIHVRAVDVETGREAKTTIERETGLDQSEVAFAAERMARMAVS